MTLTRKHPMKRGKGLSRVPIPRKARTPIKAVNRKRKAASFARCYGSVERVLWIQSLPSVVSGERPCVNAHVRGGGGSRKADACWIVPLTDQEHQNLHVVGKRFFERWAGGISLDAKAMETEAQWRAHSHRNDA